MARYQSLPDRIDTVCTTISDQAMCVNYGMVNDCCIIAANGKCQLNVINGSCAWTVPPGVSSIFIELWGAGAGGTGGTAGAVSGPGGGGGAYTAVTVPTTAGCQYSVCAGSGGGAGNNAVGSAGSPTYITGYNITTLCACGGGTGGGTLSNGMNSPNYAAASTNAICGLTFPTASNLFAAPGTAGTMMSGGNACFQSRGGTAPFNGGIGGITACINGPQSPTFPGGGGSGGNANGAIGGNGAGGLVRIWY